MTTKTNNTLYLSGTPLHTPPIIMEPSSMSRKQDRFIFKYLYEKYGGDAWTKRYYYRHCCKYFIIGKPRKRKIR